MNLNALYKMVGRAALGNEGDIGPLASMAGVSMRWLEDRLIRETGQGDGRTWRFLGRPWTSPMSLRRDKPQICTECLMEGSYCQAVWVVAGYVACGLHRLPLVDACAHCRAAISWRRPAIQVCRCRWMFGRTGETPRTPPVVAIWSRWVAQTVLDAGAAAQVAGCGQDVKALLPRWILGLSADAAFQIVFALGARIRQYERISVGDVVCCKPTALVTSILERGLERSWALDGLNARALHELDGWIYEQGIERLARRAVEAADREFAASLWHALRRVNDRYRGMGRRRHEQQPDLFEESFDG